MSTKSSTTPKLIGVTSPAARLRAKAGLAPQPKRRKGVTALLSMMFLVMFGSLSAAMAIASKGNITTAATHLHVLRAQSAAETGLAVAEARLKEAASRFLMSRSEVDANFGWDLWRGSLGSYGTYDVVLGKSGPQNVTDPAGLAAALAQAHTLETNIVSEVGIPSVTIGNAPAGTSNAIYKTTQWLFTPAVAVATQQAMDGVTPPPLCYQITYAPLANGTQVRAIVTGYDYSYTRRGQPITRTVSKDFQLSKRVDHAIISPTRVMIGKNVQVQGDMGVRFNDISFNHGDPLITRSDFKGLNASLDAKLTAFYNALETSGTDVDNDNRIRLSHAGESANLQDATNAYQTASGSNDTPFVDETGDGYVDEFDIFINHFDADHDHRVSAAEFTSGGQMYDAALFNLIDSTDPDRNRNGVYGFIDANGNGKKDGSEPFVDITSGIANDQVLGYLDGYLDRRDRYVKIAGGLMFKTDRDNWETARGSLGDKLHGAIRPNEGTPPQQYNLSDTDLPTISASNFVSDANGLQTAANGTPFSTQIASPTAVPGQTASVSMLTADANNDGLPDNNATAYFEKMPYNSPNYSDYYFRPVIRNVVFYDVEIPVGTNALFENCWFIGVTWVRSTTSNAHILWSEYGKLDLDSTTGRPKLRVPRRIYGDDSGETSYPQMLPNSAIPPNQMILMANQPMDKGDVPHNQIGTIVEVNGFGYDDLPDPLVIGGKRVTDTKAYSNNLRFHNCLFVGSIVSDSPISYSQSRNKIQFTGSTRFAQTHPDYPNTTGYNPQTADRAQIARSSMMLPGYSVDLGTFNSPQSQSVQLKGAIVAGVLDIRGNADIDGALLLTFRPQEGQFPLVDVMGNAIGNPASFNTTLGYFGPDDGDEESLDPNTLPTVGGVKIVGYDTNGDGLADAPASGPQPAGSTAVPFNGYGQVSLRWNPNMQLPNGIMLPMQFVPVTGSYREGHQ
ncbi:MAG: hypothetical protein U0640_07310 [Phycisphaerales bacterium]